MKRLLILTALFAVITIGPLTARTWTSSDGTRTFEGEFRSFDPSTGTVSVVIGGTLRKFHRDLLSPEDREFIAGISAPKDSTADLEKTRMGSIFAKAKLHRIEGKKFAEVKIEKVPEYYILYYSASW
jgi:hypothetical protein